MFRIGSRLALIIIGVLLLAGCTGKSSGPVSPDIGDVTSDGRAAQRILWGMWDITFDEASLEASIAPVRNTEGHHNITQFLIPPNCTDCLLIEVNSFDAVSKLLDVDITLYNPFPVQGYDVRGIFYTDDAGRTLMNADDWIGLWDLPGGQEINPFKAFAKAEVNRIFESEAAHTENYIIYLPTWAPVHYAVDASAPDNCAEPYRITGFTQDEIPDDIGAVGDVQVIVSDWQGDVSEVTIEVEEITGEPFTNFTSIGNDIWTLSLANNAGAPAGEYPARIYAKSDNYANLVLYDYVTINIVETPSGENGWVKTWDETEFGLASELSFDSDGNIIVVGGIQDGDGLSPSVMKLDPQGVLIWERYLPGNDDYYNPCGFDGVAVDEFNNIYATGFFSGEVDFDPGPGEDIHVSTNSMDILLVKLDTGGNYVWGKHWGGDLDPAEMWFEVAHGVALDELGGVYVTGMYRGTCDFDPGPGEETRTSNGYDLAGYDAFLSKFDSDGEFQWVNTWGAGVIDGIPNGLNGDTAFGVAIENCDRIYVTGGFLGTVDFDSGPGVDERTAEKSTGDCYLIRFDYEGNYKWVRTWPGNGEAVLTATGFSQRFGGNALAITLNGDIYISGRFSSVEGPVDFDPGPGVDERTGEGAFLTRFTPDGDYVRAQTWAGEPALYKSGTAVATDNTGNVIVFGMFTDNIDLDPGIGFDERTGNGISAFMCRLNDFGVYEWGLTFGLIESSGPGMCVPGGIRTDSTGNVYGSGYFQGTVDFDPGPGTYTASGNFYDSYLVKFTSDGIF